MHHHDLRATACKQVDIHRCCAGDVGCTIVAALTASNATATPAAAAAAPVLHRVVLEWLVAPKPSGTNLGRP